MSHPLIGRLERHGSLSGEEKQVLRDISSRTAVYRPREEIVPEGSTPAHSSLILSGFATRHNHSLDGKRQITAFHVPGDFADLHSFLLKKMEDGVAALTECTVAQVAHSDLKEITKNYPYLTRVLWHTTLVDAAVHRAWMTTLGRMEARERLAHFLCEMRDRLDTIGLMQDNSYELPITQEELGDAFGISTVHVNRVLQDLRAEGLITSRGKTLVINDWERLQQVGQYSSDYLHIDQKLERD
ncbi:Crp/Fnr family transcriptional regulator [Microvirga makkahensis]|uniref:Helix-turn-helix domain-containing protein n=1 Tax=Microvirga makkahensis TaxID=1128670 RepID=A0A7X3MXL5_9HYPH|nr:Crp/Fnr family transcriptional regulator [Microvirga makkahensis]MXQ14815.1 helix-turn-helix domain-containing protein [Microvirga makkahensis]